MTLKRHLTAGYSEREVAKKNVGVRKEKENEIRTVKESKKE